jgi:hypothetical protein
MHSRSIHTWVSKTVLTQEYISKTTLDSTWRVNSESILQTSGVKSKPNELYPFFKEEGIIFLRKEYIACLLYSD